MKCEQFERRMHQLLDRRLPPEADASLRAHAVVCPSCHEMLEVQGLLLGQVALPFPARGAANRSSQKQAPRPGEALPHGTWWEVVNFLDGLCLDPLLTRGIASPDTSGQDGPEKSTGSALMVGSRNVPSRTPRNPTHLLWRLLRHPRRRFRIRWSACSWCHTRTGPAWHRFRLRWHLVCDRA